MTHTYTPRGVCSRQITFDLNDGIGTGLSFLGGCNGNLQGISRLVEGLSAEEAIRRLEGIQCGFKSTSCPDQLAQALKAALNAKNAK